MAAVLNAASNAINQIYDLEIDRVNKPKRPLPSGMLASRDAWGFTIGAFLLAWMLAWLAAPEGRRECFWIVMFTSVLVWQYSAPPLRTKHLTGNPMLLLILGPALILYGAYTVYLLVRRPEELAATENHPSWTHVYGMMMVAQIGFALAYVF